MNGGRNARTRSSSLGVLSRQSVVVGEAIHLDGDKKTGPGRSVSRVLPAPDCLAPVQRRGGPWEAWLQGLQGLQGWGFSGSWVASGATTITTPLTEYTASELSTAHCLCARTSPDDNYSTRFRYCRIRPTLVRLASRQCISLLRVSKSSLSAPPQPPDPATYFDHSHYDHHLNTSVLHALSHQLT